MASIDRHPGGRWRARWRTPDGRSRSQVFDGKVDAERHLTKLEHSSSSVPTPTRPPGGSRSPITGPPGRSASPGATHRACRSRPCSIATCCRRSAPGAWRDSSRMSITSLFHRHVLPAFGTRGLASLRRGEIETWAARLPLSARTTAQATRYLSTMLEAAVVDGLIATNPAHRARRPRVEQDPVVPFTDTEVEALRAAAPCGFAVALDLGLGAGPRQSEATGLSVDRIDFLRRELTVDRQLVTRKAGEPTFGPPKSKRSYRRVPLADAVVSALARHVEVHGDGRDGLVLHGLDGRPRAASASASCGASSGPEPTCLPPGSTTPATPSPRRCCRAGCRWRRPSTSGTARARCWRPTRTSCRPTTSGPAPRSPPRSARQGPPVSRLCQGAESASAP